jgi:hypothetical protein
MIRKFFKINHIIFKRNFSLDRKLPSVIYLESTLNNKKIGVKSEKKEDEMKIEKNNIKIKKREISDGDLLHLLPPNKKNN